MGKLVTFALVDDDDETYVSCDEDEIIALGRIDDEAIANNLEEMEHDDFDDDEEKEEKLLLKLELKTFS